MLDSTHAGPTPSSPLRGRVRASRPHGAPGRTAVPVARPNQRRRARSHAVDARGACDRAGPGFRSRADESLPALSAGPVAVRTAHRRASGRAVRSVAGDGAFSQAPEDRLLRVACRRLVAPPAAGHVPPYPGAGRVAGLDVGLARATR